MIIQADRIIARPDRVPIIDGAVVVKDGQVLALGKAASMIRKYPGHGIMRLGQAVVMPGLVNVHAHLELPPLLDRVRAETYHDWVLNLLKAKKFLAMRDYQLAVQRNISSLLRSGTTMVGEICTHGASLPVLRRSGLRAIVYHEIISMARDRRHLMLPRCGRVSRLVRCGFSPHSAHTVSEAALRAVKTIASRRHLPLCMHVAETRDESLLLQRKKSGLERLYAAAGWDVSLAPAGRSSFGYLHRLGLLGTSLLAVHAVQADEEDRALIKRTRTGVAHCPRSNHALGVGTMPLKEFLDAGIPVGLGTDSLASSPTLNLWDEMRYAFALHRASGITPRDILQTATLGGARALAMDQEIGSLEPGKKADCIAVALPRRNTGDLCSDLLRETKTCIMAMVNGRVLWRTDPGRLV